MTFRRNADPKWKRRQTWLSPEILEQRCMLDADGLCDVDLDPVQVESLRQGTEQLAGFFANLETLDAIARPLNLFTRRDAQPMSVGSWLDLEDTFQTAIVDPTAAYFSTAANPTSAGLTAQLQSQAIVDSVEGGETTSGPSSLLFNADFGDSVTINDFRIGLSTIGEVLGMELDQEVSGDLTLRLGVELTYGVTLDTNGLIDNSRDLQDIFFVDDLRITLGVDATLAGSFDAQVGFLDVVANVGTQDFTADMDVTISVDDAFQDAEGRTRLSDLTAGFDALSLVQVETEVNEVHGVLAFDVAVGPWEFEGTPEVTIGGSLVGEDITATANTDYESAAAPFRNIDASLMALGADAIGGWFDSFVAAGVLGTSIPFSTAEVGEILDIGTSYRNLTAGLRDADGLPSFESAQGFSLGQSTLSGFDPNTQTLLYDVVLDLDSSETDLPVSLNQAVGPINGLTTNGTQRLTSAAQATFTLGVDLSRSVEPDFGVDSEKAAGSQSPSEAFSISDFQFNGSVTQDASSLVGEALYGILGLDIGDVSVQGGPTVALSIADSKSVRELISGLVRPAGYFQTAISGSTDLVLQDIVVADNLVGLPSDASILLRKTDFSSNHLQFIPHNVGPLDLFSNLSFDQILGDLLPAIENFASSFQEATASSLSIVRTDPNDIIDTRLTGLSSQLNDQLENYSEQASGLLSLQRLAPLLEQEFEFGIGNHTEFAVKTSFDPDSNDLQLNLDVSFSGDHALPFGLNISQWIENTSSDGLVAGGEVSTDALIAWAATATMSLDTGFNLSNPAQPVPVLYDSTQLSASFEGVAGFDAQVSSLGMLGLAIDGELSLTNVDDRTPTLMVTLPPSPTNGRYQLNQLSGLSLIVDPIQTDLDVDLTMSLMPLEQIQTTLVVNDGVVEQVPDFAEMLEDIQDITLNLSVLAQGVDGLLSGIETALSGQIFGLQVPVIGEALEQPANAVRTFRNAIQPTLDDVASQGPDAIADAWENALQSALGGVVDVAVVIDEATQEVLLTISRPENQPGLVSTFDAHSSLGLPALGVNIDAQFEADFVHDFAFTIGVNPRDGVFLSTHLPAELSVDGGVFGTGGFSGQLGFLTLTGEIANPQDPLFTGYIGIDLKDPNGDGKLTMAELSEPDFQFVHLDLDASADLQVELRADALAFLPELVTTLNVSWDSSTGDPPAVSLSDLHIPLDGLLDNFLGSFIRTVDDIVSPIVPVANALTTPLPILSDLLLDSGISSDPTTLLTLAELFLPIDTGFIEAIDAVSGIVTTVGEILGVIEGDSNENIRLSFGDINFENRDLTDADALKDGIDDLIDAADPLAALASSVASGLVDTLGLTNSDNSANKDNGFSASGFSIPILENPASVFGLLLGLTDDVGLIAWDIPELSFFVPIDISFAFPPFPALQMGFYGGVGVGADLNIGYDTVGLVKFKDSKDPVDLFDGFFVGDTDQPNGEGNDVPEFEVTGEAKFQASLGIPGVVGAGIAGGVVTTLAADLVDNDGDGKFRGSEFFDGGCIIALQGSMDIELEVFVRLLGSRHDFPFGEFNIAQFDLTPNCPFLAGQSGDENTVLADRSNETLTLLVGDLADQRSIAADTIDENYSVTHRGSDMVVSAFGKEQTFDLRFFDITRIVANAGDGNDTIIIDDSVRAEVELDGGRGNDVLRGGSGENTLRGRSGNDILIGNQAVDNLDGGANDDLISGYGGDDIIEGGPGSDEIDGGEDDDTITDVSGPTIVRGGPGSDTITTGDDNDTIYTGEGRNNEVHSGGGNDVVIGGSGRETVFAGQGNDEVYGADGKDTIHGGPGEDILSGEGGSDTIYGGTENDLIVGGNDIDTLHGEGGNDIIYGQGGNDFVYGGAGLDEIYGDEGEDELYGEADADEIHGGPGGDTIDGGLDNDTIYGDEGPDTLDGDAGDDWIDGGADADTINGGANADTLYGRMGIDTIRGNDGNDFIDGGEGDDLLYGEANQDEIEGGPGNDTIQGNRHDDILRGGPGDDIISGGFQHDRISGGPGEDTIHGDAGHDVIDGGSDDDQIFGGTEHDNITGAEGDDYIEGNDGDDTLRGGSGRDTMEGHGGKDFIDGGLHDDLIYGGDDEDEIYGREGADIIRGGSQDDWINGGPGNDLLVGNDGSDIILGEDGVDILYGMLGHDTLEGGDGDDRLHGKEGNDILRGGRGSDLLEGDDGNDVLSGDEQNDRLFGGLGKDSLDGGSGDDYLDAVAGRGNTLRGGPHDDTLIGSGDGLSTFDPNTATGDFLYGDDGDDDIRGLGGADWIEGGLGRDTIDGGSHQDQIDGGPGLDNIINGGSDIVVPGDNNISPAATSPKLGTGETDTDGRWVQLSGSASANGISGIGGVEQSLLRHPNGETYVAWVDSHAGNNEIFVARHSGGQWQEINGSASNGGISQSETDSRRPTLLAFHDDVVVAWVEFDVDGQSSQIRFASMNSNWGPLQDTLPSNATRSSTKVLLAPQHAGLTAAWLRTVNGIPQVFSARYLEQQGGDYAWVDVANVTADPSVRVDDFDFAGQENHRVVAISYGADGNRRIGISHADFTANWSAIRELSFEGDNLHPAVSLRRNIAQAAGNERGYDYFVAWQEDTDRTNQVRAVVERNNFSNPAASGVFDMHPHYANESAPRLTAESISDTLAYAGSPELSKNGTVWLAWIDDDIREDEIDSRIFATVTTVSNVFYERFATDASGNGITSTGGAMRNLSIDQLDGEPGIAWNESATGTPAVFYRFEPVERVDLGTIQGVPGHPIELPLRFPTESRDPERIHVTHAIVDWGDSTLESSASDFLSETLLHTYNELVDYEATVTMTNEAGETIVGTATIEMVPLLIEADRNSINEGEQITLSGRLFDQLPQIPNELRIQWDDSGPPQVVSIANGQQTTFQIEHIYADDSGPQTAYTIGASITGLAASTASHETDVQVVNVSPDFDAGKNAESEVAPFLFARSISFSDPGIDDKHSILVDWGDKTETQYEVPLASRESDIRHEYAAAGLYIVSVTISDDDRGSLTDTFEVRVGTDSGNPTTPHFSTHLLSSNRTSNSLMGLAIAFDGDRAVVAAPSRRFLNDTGKVYVFERDTTTWTETAILLPDETTNHDPFGASVALLGDSIFVGATFADVQGEQRGAVYVYTFDGKSWQRTDKLFGSKTAVASRFGQSLHVSHAPDGSQLLLVGAPGIGNTLGSAYVFRNAGSGWTEEALMIGDDPTELRDSFGISVFADGNQLIVGAEYQDTDNGRNRGAAYVFTLDQDRWIQTARLEASGETREVDRFGASVILDGDTAFVGAPNDSVGVGTSLISGGAVYVFNREKEAGGWTQTTKIRTEEVYSLKRRSAEFGGVLSLDGDTLVIGARRYDGTRGAIYQAQRANDRWTLGDRIVGESESLYFGHALVCVDGRLLVGAPLYNDFDVRYTGGTVFVFNDGSNPQPLPGDLGEPDGEVGFRDFLILAGNFGKKGATRLEGDIDGDGTVGFSDFLILAGNFGRAI